ncbi:MAG: helix-turn-helix domain-containing protein [Dietzia sp.]
MGFRRELADAVPENRVRFVGHPEHVHEVPHLVHMVMGRGHLRVDGESITLEPRTSVLLAPLVPHSLELDEHSIALGPFLSHRASPVERVRRLGVVPEITHLMLARLAAQPYTDEQVAPFTDGLEEILAHLHTDEFAAPLPVHPTARQIAAAATGTADTLASLCAGAGISTRQVQRLFLAETGLPFHRWRTRRRLNRAIRSLRGGSSAEGAARAAGYSGRGSLLRALSRETGVPVELLRDDPLGHLVHARRPAPV